MYRRQCSRQDLTVSDVAHSISALDVIDYASLDRVCIGDLVSEFQHRASAHLLVVETASAGAPPRIRGLFSRSQLQRQLEIDIPIAPVASTFAEIERAIAA
jgi:hypothetical protein